MKKLLLGGFARFIRYRKAVAKVVPGVMANLLYFGGMAAVSYGIWMIYRPAGVIAAGLCGIKTALLIGAEMPPDRR